MRLKYQRIWEFEEFFGEVQTPDNLKPLKIKSLCYVNRFLHWSWNLLECQTRMHSRKHCQTNFVQFLSSMPANFTRLSLSQSGELTLTHSHTKKQNKFSEILFDKIITSMSTSCLARPTFVYYFTVFFAPNTHPTTLIQCQPVWFANSDSPARLSLCIQQIKWKKKITQFKSYIFMLCSLWLVHF